MEATNTKVTTAPFSALKGFLFVVVLSTLSIQQASAYKIDIMGLSSTT
jgi:hypothetical protein